MLKALTIVGARPQFIKASAISRAIRGKFSNDIHELILHTGQHYDENMSKVFFEELDIPAPEYNLGIGSASHGVQTAGMIKGVEELLLAEKPDFLIIYGDTNSTLAGSIAASKLHIPVVHIEAGLRSFNKIMPEEINRIVCDHISTLLFTPTVQGIDNLKHEGFNTNNKSPYSIDNPGIFLCGDVMYDNTMYFASIAEKRSRILEANKLEKENYILVTVHREQNTDDPKRLNAIFTALHAISTDHHEDLVIPLHPRTAKILESRLSAALYKAITENPRIRIIPAVSYLDMVQLERHASLIMTDSGGVQKEAYFFKGKCIILRAETEWTELVDHGMALLADANTVAIVDAYKYLKSTTFDSYPPVYGNGEASEFICSTIIKAFRK